MPGAGVDAVTNAPAPLGIEGASVLDLPIIPTPGGPVLRMLRPDCPLFLGFGEIYFSEALPGAVKAWKRHARQTQIFAVPVGRIHIVLYDDREGSPSRGEIRELTLGRPDDYRLLRIPPMVWYGFAAEGGAPALICNCADMPHDPVEAERRAVDDPAIPYAWKR